MQQDSELETDRNDLLVYNSSESEITTEEEEPLPEELKDFEIDKTKTETNKLFELMKLKIEEDKNMIEMERAERENERILKIAMVLKEDSKVHLDSLFEELYNHVKNFA